MPVPPEFDAVRPVVDPLSAALDEVRAVGGRSYRSRLPPGWSLSFAASPACVFHVLERGRAQLWLADAVHEVHPGELLLLPRGDAHTIGEHAAGLAVTFPAVASEDADWTRGGPCAAELVCGEVWLRDSAALPLLDTLPAVLRVRDDGVVGGILALLQREADHRTPGSAAMVTRLVEVLALQAVRAWALREDAAPSWASGVRDPAVGRALARIHAEPEVRWSVAALARVAGCSRSRFSARFTALVGVPPATYLRQVRLQAVAEALARGERVGTVARERGYASAAAFSRAYKRVTGQSPRQARRELAADGT